MAKPIIVKATWDPEAEVWYTEHSTLPGLHLDAETIDGLQAKLPGAIEDLLEGTGEQEVSFELVTPGHVKIQAQRRRIEEGVLRHRPLRPM
jgi:hypothetical protein